MGNGQDSLYEHLGYPRYGSASLCGREGDVAVATGRTTEGSVAGEVSEGRESESCGLGV